MKAKFNGILTLLIALSVQFVFAQKTVSGTVSDDSGALPGASVMIKDTKTGIETDFDGKYTLQAKQGDVLVFSYVGLETVEKTVGTNNTIDVVMSPDNNVLDEVIVVAYGTSKKGDYTGAATQISSKELDKRALSNISNAIEGSVAGVTANMSSGQPGGGQDIRIRGFTSINASNDPMYVLDGVPFNGSLSSINSNDIESVTILKDASSTALYGNKAANGVVIITTKKGKSKGGQFSLNVTNSFIDRALPEYDRLSAAEYYPIMWEAMRNTQAIPGVNTQAEVDTANQYATNNIFDSLLNNPFNVADDAIVGVDGKLNSNAQLLYDDIDWVKAVTRKGYRQNYDINYQGATDKSDYYISVGYLDEDGFLMNSNFNRISGRANVNYQATDWIKTGFNVGTSYSNGNQAQATSTDQSNYAVNPFRFSRNIGPIYNIYQHNPDGSFVLDEDGNKVYAIDAQRGVGASSGRHIVAETEWNKDLDEITSLNGKTFVDINLYKGLKFTLNGSYEQRQFYNTDYNNKLVGDGAPLGRASRTFSKRTTKGFNQLLNYELPLNKHNFKFLLGHESIDLTYNYMYASRSGQIADDNDELVNFITTDNLYSYTDKLTDESYFGRFNYDFDNKYYLSASYRTDGTSKFAQDKRWGDFWSLGLSWRLDNESFLENIDWLNLLKIRASYGELGNNFIDSYYPYQGLYDLDYNNQGESGILQATLPAPLLEWEKNTNSDVALEFGFLNRLDGTIEYYNKISDNLLFELPLPLSSGSESIWTNIGTMYNRGIEVSLNYQIIKKEHFNWNFGLNTATIKNEITKLPQDEIISGSKKLMVGHSLYDYWLKDWYGVDPADGAALYYANEDAIANAGSDIREINGNMLTTNQANAVYHYAGTAIPDFTGGISNAFNYKNFGLSFMLTYQKGGQSLDYNYQAIMSSGNYGGALSTDILNRWQKPGDITNVPRMDATQTTNFGATSDRWLVDSSFLNFKQANLTYNFGEQLLDKIKVASAQLYITGENLFSFNARKGLNIQEQFNGTTANLYTPARTFTFGFNVKF